MSVNSTYYPTLLDIFSSLVDSLLFLLRGFCEKIIENVKKKTLFIERALEKLPNNLYNSLYKLFF